MNRLVCFFIFFIYVCFVKHSLVKDTIVKTASHLFYSRGYNLTGINEIIKEAGIAKATLYNHFKSKDDICLAYLDYRHTAFMENIKNFCDDQKDNPVIAIFDFLETFFNDKEFNGCWCLNTFAELPRENEKIKDEIKRQKNEFMSFIKILVEQHVSKEVRDSNPELYQQIYLLYEGAVSESHLHGKVWPILSAKKLGEGLMR